MILNKYRSKLNRLRRKEQRISQSTRGRIIFRDNNRCRYCSRKLNNNQIHLDHVKPLSKGGKVLFNLVVSCKSCNMRKGTKQWIPNKHSVFNYWRLPINFIWWLVNLELFNWRYYI